jgi:hypothetical protein
MDGVVRVSFYKTINNDLFRPRRLVSSTKKAGTWLACSRVLMVALLR